MRYTAARVADKYAVLVNGDLVDEFDSMDKAIARRDEIAAGALYEIPVDSSDSVDEKPKKAKKIKAVKS